MRIFDDIEAERDRIQKCIQKFGWTSDHNLDWWACSTITPDGVPVFVEFDDGTGLLAHRYLEEWRVWSDPLCAKSDAAKKIIEFALEIFKDKRIKEVWCDDFSDNIYPELKNIISLHDLTLSDFVTGIYPENKPNPTSYYHLFWPVLEMASYNPLLPGGHFKEMRNARNKFYREHRIEITDAKVFDNNKLIWIVDGWKKNCGSSRAEPEYIYDLRYRHIIEKKFRGFDSARVMVVDGRAVGFNAGYNVVNMPGRYATVIGIHDYSLKDLGVALYLEDLDWVKKAGYKEIDMQGSEYANEIKYKSQFGKTIIERRTDTFSIQVK